MTSSGGATCQDLCRLEPCSPVTSTEFAASPRDGQGLNKARSQTQTPIPRGRSPMREMRPAFRSGVPNNVFRRQPYNHFELHDPLVLGRIPSPWPLLVKVMRNESPVSKGAGCNTTLGDHKSLHSCFLGTAHYCQLHYGDLFSIL